MQKEELRFAEAIATAVFVTTAGTWQMPLLSVGNLDLMVWRFSVIFVVALALINFSHSI